MVREFDLEERDVVWFLVDASVELWAGLSGQTPLDRAIEQAAALAERHLEVGNRVGLLVVAGRRLAMLAPASGSAHAARIMEALSFATNCHDVDRSEFDEQDVAIRVLEHLRPLEPTVVEGVRSNDVDKLSRRAAVVLTRAPFSLSPPAANSEREAVLRHYLAAFGIDSPPKLEPDRPRTDTELLSALTDILRQKPRPSLVTVVSPLPQPSQQKQLLEGLKRLPRRHCEIRWLPIPLRGDLNELFF
jgi:hypothetical protein